jgi:hypothetical protein
MAIDPELWLDIAFPDGRVISGREHGAPHPSIGPEGKPTILGCGPLRIRCVEPFKHWTISFGPHRVRELTTQQLIDAAYPERPPMRELKPATAVQVPWMRKLYKGGENVPLVLNTADGLVAITGTTFVNCRSPGASVLPASFPVVQQAHARYRWNDEEACGMIERSTLRDQME